MSPIASPSNKAFGEEMISIALNPVIALESPAYGTCSGTGVLGAEAFPAQPFLDLLAWPQPDGYGSPWGLENHPPQTSQEEQA